MSLALGTRLVVLRLRTQGALVLVLNTGPTGGYCLGASQRASGGTADTPPGPPRIVAVVPPSSSSSVE
jgi:hypothetical protein